MGCDIHAFYERQNRETGLWENITPGQWEADEYVKSDGTTVQMRYWDQPWRDNKYYIGRDYWLFGVLAQVRCEITPSFEPKGFPDDASAEVAEEYRRWDCDAHTPSYLTAKELQDFVKEHCTPDAKMTALVQKDEDMQKNLADFESELTELANNMLELAGEGVDPDDVRLVFWFDN